MIESSISAYGLPFIVVAGLRQACASDQLDVNDYDNLDSFINEAHQFDLLITGMDHHLDESFKAYLSAHQPNVLLMLGSEAEADVKYLASLGINAIVNWDCPKEEILTAVQMARKGKKYICDRLLEHMLLPKTKMSNPAVEQLSDREMEVLLLIAKGLTTNHIATKMHLSMHTVNSHRKNIMKKLDLKHPPQLITYAWKTGLVKSE